LGGRDVVAGNERYIWNRKHQRLAEGPDRRPRYRLRKPSAHSPSLRDQDASHMLIRSRTLQLCALRASHRDMSRHSRDRFENMKR
jgi:hypothetical protein